MMPIVQKPGVSLLQKRLALLVAGGADFLQIVAFPAFFPGGASPFEDALDFIVAILLMAICGFRWQWVLAFMMELMPGLDLLPTWTMVVALMPVQGEVYRGFQVEQGEGYGVGPVEVTRVDEAAEEVVDVDAVVVPPVRGPRLTDGR